MHVFLQLHAAFKLTECVAPAANPFTRVFAVDTGVVRLIDIRKLFAMPAIFPFAPLIALVMFNC